MSLLLLFPASSTQTPQSVSGGMTPAGVVVKRANAVKVGGATPGGTVVKRVGALRSGGTTPSGVVISRKAKTMAGGITPTALIQGKPNKWLIAHSGQRFEPVPRSGVHAPNVEYWDNFAQDTDSYIQEVDGGMYFNIPDYSNSDAELGIKPLMRMETTNNAFLEFFISYPAAIGSFKVVLNDEAHHEQIILEITLDGDVLLSGYTNGFLGIDYGNIGAINPDFKLRLEFSPDDGGTLYVWSQIDDLSEPPVLMASVQLLPGDFNWIGESVRIVFTHVSGGGGTFEDSHIYNVIASSGIAPIASDLDAEKQTSLQLVSVGGGVTPNATLFKRAGIALSAAQAAAGTLVRSILSRQAGSITPTGIAAVRPAKVVNGTLLPAASLSKQVLWVLTGSGTPGGTLSTVVRKLVSGALTPTAVLGTLKLTLVLLTGSVTPTASLFKRSTASISGGITPTGLLLKWLWKSLIAALTPSATTDSSFVRQQVISGSETPAGSTTLRPDKVATGTVSPTGALTRLIDHFVAGVIIPAGLLSFRVQKFLLAGATPVGTLITSKSQGGVSLDGTILSAANLTALPKVQRFGAVAPTSDVHKAIVHLFGGLVTPAATTAEFAKKALTANITPSSILFLTRRRVLSLAGTITSTAIIVRRVGIVIVASLLPGGILRSLIRKTFSGSETPSGTVSRPVTRPKTVQGSETPTALTRVRPNKNRFKYMTLVAGVLRSRVTKTFVGSVTSTGIISKRPGKVAAETVGSSSTVASRKTFAQALSGVITSTGQLSRQTRLAIIAYVFSQGNVTKRLTAQIAGLVTSSGLLRKQLLLAVEAGTTPSGLLQLVTTYQKSLAGSLSPASFLVDYAVHVFPLYFTAKFMPAVSVQLLMEQTLTLVHKLEGTSMKIDAAVVQSMSADAKLDQTLDLDAELEDAGI